MQAGAQSAGIPMRWFAKGANNEEIVRPLIEAAGTAGGDGRVVLIGGRAENPGVSPRLIRTPDMAQKLLQGHRWGLML